MGGKDPHRRSRRRVGDSGRSSVMIRRRRFTVLDPKPSRLAPFTTLAPNVSSVIGARPS